MEEKLSRYFNRTIEHIHRVHKNMFYLITNHQQDLKLSDENCRELAYQVLNHDRSKFNKGQYEPYVELTEYYHQRKKLGNKDYQYPSERIKEQVDKAVDNHYHNENHHPERYGTLARFSDLETIEIICDLQAMADEFGEGSCRGYFENTWLPKHNDKSSALFIGYAYRVVLCFEKRIEQERVLKS